ncbi:MAG TPA: ABC transporter permease [Terracidiphilus sp.]
MNLSRVSAVVMRQFFLYRGSVARAVPLFAWVTIDMVLWGFMTKFLSGIAAGSYRFVPALLGAVLFWDFMTRVMQGVTTAFFEDVWTRNFLNVFASPITVAEYMTGLLLSSMATSMLGLLFMVAIATAGFGLHFAAYGVMLVPFLVVLFLFGLALGIAATAIVLRLGPAAEWFVWPIPALMAPFAAVYYPLATLPVWMRAISRLLPASYVFEGMRAVVQGQHFDPALLALAAALALLYILAAYWLFARVFRSAVKTGLLARYSAESVS